jgi:integrase
MRAGLRQQPGAGPRFHDLRHSFAVRRLVTWYEEKTDVQAMLPALATYMGHVHYTDTAYYLQATSELLGVAVERFYCFLQQREVNR